VYIAVNQNFDDDLLLKYSEVERAKSIDEVKHPLLRECLRATDISKRIEISSMADVPAGTGLGSSGSFAVGLLKALHLYSHRTPSAEYLAEQACEIEINRLCEPIGKQDQYIAAVGGVSTFTFRDDETVEVDRLAMADISRSQLEDNLLLFYTGIKRSASAALSTEAQNAIDSKKPVENLSDTRAIGYETRDILLTGDMNAFGRALTNQWNLKYQRQPSLLHDEINSWIQTGIMAGAQGGKLVGAGGGGFLLFYADRKTDLRRAMSEIGLPEISFGVDYEGSCVTTAR
jgi:D-glycero-alpha-D-manno-heptose-7-phosphate kinase